jgi:tripartite-type tricarboxylate transporter receptor subunit TctC
MKTKKMGVLVTCLVIISVLSVPSVWGQSGPDNYPAKPIRIVVPFAAGAVADLTARILADAVRKYLPNNQALVVENKAGGGGTIGTLEVVKSNPDGYTILSSTNGPITMQPHYGNVPYSYDSLIPVIGVTTIPIVMVVRSDAPWKTFDEWLNWAKANPNKFIYGTPGKGTFGHIVAYCVDKATGIASKAVFFSGGAPSLTALLGGHVQGVATTATDVKAYVDSGDMRVLYITGKSEFYPNATVLKDKGINIDLMGWVGVFVPKGVPDRIRVALHDAYKKALEDPTTKERLRNTGAPVTYASSEQLTKMVKNEFVDNKVVLQELGLIK